MGKNFISLQTKVNKATNERFQACAQRAGLKSGYELMQVLITAFLRVADPEHEPGEVEIEEAESIKRWSGIYEHWMDETRRLNTSKPLREREEALDEAVLLFRQPGHRAHSVRRVTFAADEPMYIARDVDGTINALLRKLKPEMATSLLEIGRACGTKNLMEAVEALLEDTTIPRVKDDGQSVLPGMAAVEYGGGYVRHNNKRGENGATI